MGLEFRVALKEVDETYPLGLRPAEVAVHIAEKKAHAFDETLTEGEAVITADTIVTVNEHILGKPENEEEAYRMLELLSGRKHEVITGVSIIYNRQVRSFSVVTEVFFKELSRQEIAHYIENYKPYDKAGAYGIQEWIGLVAIERIEGSYTNVVGLPTERLYKELLTISSGS